MRLTRLASPTLLHSRSRTAVHSIHSSPRRLLCFVCATHLLRLRSLAASPTLPRPAGLQKRDFDTALKHYEAGLELDPQDVSFFTNRAAVHFELGNFDKCIKAGSPAPL